MGRPSKNANKEAETKGKETEVIIEDTEIVDTSENVEISETIESTEITTPENQNVEIPANVDRLMRLYRQYEKIYVTKEGFVHPEDAPAMLVKEATLYVNKYYNKQ